MTIITIMDDWEGLNSCCLIDISELTVLLGETMRMQRSYVPERCSGKPPHLLPQFVLLGSIRVLYQLTNDEVSYCSFP